MKSTKRLEGKRAIVTGSAMGLGEAIARRFAAEGAAVLCVDIQRQPNEAVVASINDADGTAFSVIADVAAAAEVERIGAEAQRLLGEVDILVNNAGIIPSRETVLNTPEEDWENTIRVNVKSVFLMSRMAIPLMIARGGGAIINLSSITGLVGLPVRPAYSASKGAVAALSRQMAVDFGKHQIRVNAIAPSFVITSLNRALFDKMKAAGEPWRDMLDQHPLGRLGKPDDIASAALWLASNESSWVTGICLPVDGGYTAK